MPIKLTQVQLRRIIKEETDELSEPGGQESYDLAWELVHKIVSHWENTYNEGDPSMAQVGRKVWLSECNDAAEHLAAEIAAAIDRIEEKLLAGEYHR